MRTSLSLRLGGWGLFKSRGLYMRWGVVWTARTMQPSALNVVIILVTLTADHTSMAA